MQKHFVSTTLIFKDNKVLLLKHKKLGSWLPPGGHIEENEAAHEAAIREAKEETGFDIEIISSRTKKIQEDEMTKELPCPILCLEECIPAYKDHKEHKHLDFVFLAKIKGSEILKNPEEELRWFTKQEIEALTSKEIFSNVKQICLEFFE